MSNTISNSRTPPKLKVLLNLEKHSAKDKTAPKKHILNLEDNSN